ncbi:PKD domain-containing protein [Actinokineospora guangxiensis]|uniref:PKD domain-containing protein n=1 Tax=Actinokineospora guangxiensis TaxID=1490288 RepID=A0ABW0EYP4_9PSEU
MTTMRPSTRATACLAALAATALLPSVAHAAPPSNDDFDTATEITALPFTTVQDTTEATAAADEPAACWRPSGGASVWYRFTATAHGFLRATFGTSDHASTFVAFTGERDALTAVPGSCGSRYDTAGRKTFAVAAGTTYHLLVSDNAAVGGTLHFGLESVPPAPNDRFADATPITAIPAVVTDGNLARAGAEPGEPVPACAQGATSSIWYRYTPTTTAPVSLWAGAASAAMVVYEGARLDELSEVRCTPPGPAVFTATAGRTYHIQIASDPDQAGVVDLHAALAPALRPTLIGGSERLTVLRDEYFGVYPGDVLNQPVAAGRIDFGDGTAVDLTAQEPGAVHRYAVDGDYRVQFTVTTLDGRTGSGTKAVQVRSHDVTTTALSAPATARLGQTRTISASVTNTRYDETVVVTLYKVVDGNSTEIGRATQWVPARAGRVAQFPFAHTFTDTGPATFRAVAEPQVQGGDDNPADNAAEATTTVRPRAAATS